MTNTSTDKNLRLEDVKRVTDAIPYGDGWRGHCPHPAHPDEKSSLDIERGDTQEVIYTCRTRRCPKDEITAALRKLIGNNMTSSPAPKTAKAKRRKNTTKDYDWPDKWRPLTEETYRAICASRSHSYTPRLTTLRWFGFHEKNGKSFAYPVYRPDGSGPVLFKAAPVAVGADGKRPWFQFADIAAGDEIPQDSLVASHYSLRNIPEPAQIMASTKVDATAADCQEVICAGTFQIIAVLPTPMTIIKAVEEVADGLLIGLIPAEQAEVPREERAS